MIRNYMLSIWRYVRRNSAFTAIDVLGLAIGMTAFLLIWKNDDHIYRMQQDRYNKGELSTQRAPGCNGIDPDLYGELSHLTGSKNKSSAVSKGGVV